MKKAQDDLTGVRKIIKTALLYCGVPNPKEFTSFLMLLPSQKNPVLLNEGYLRNIFSFSHLCL